MATKGFKLSAALELTVPENIGTTMRQERILDAMAEAVSTASFSATTIADIVGRARVSRATFYKHFDDKELCFEAAVNAFIEELREAATSAHGDEDEPAVVICKWSEAVLEHLAAKPHHAKMALVETLTIRPMLIERCRRLIIDAVAAQWPPEELPDTFEAEARAACGRAQVLICGKILAGQAKSLPELLPDIVYIALLPILGPDRASEHSRKLA